MADDPQVMRPAVAETYGPMDLSGLPMFAGGFINFGCWRAVDLTGSVGEPERVRSQEDLYRLVLDGLGPLQEAAVLEVGCGLGMGGALALREYGPASVTGLDIHPEQLARARAAHPDVRGLRFVQGAAESVPLDDGSFDAVLSVEAAQHFPDLGAFAREAARVLRPAGRIAVAGFFTPGRPEQLAELLETFASGLDIARPVEALTDALTAAGFTHARVEAIGADVWPGWDLWLARMWAADTWPRNFLRAYERGLIDYYVVTARL